MLGIETVRGCRLLSMNRKGYEDIVRYKYGFKFLSMQHKLVLKFVEFATQNNKMLGLNTEDKILFLCKNYPSIFSYFSQKDIASFKAMSGEVLCRTLPKLREAGKISDTVVKF